MTETFNNQEEFEKNYKEAVKKFEGKNVLQKVLLKEGFLASISLVFCVSLCVGWIQLYMLGHPYLGVFCLLAAIYEAWWTIRKLLGCITLIVGGVK